MYTGNYYSLSCSGASKLNIDGTELSVVLEEDGTVIDDDEVLQELRDKVFLLLETGQAWASHQMTLVVQDQSSFEDFGPASTDTPLPVTFWMPKEPVSLLKVKVMYHIGEDFLT